MSYYRRPLTQLLLPLLMVFIIHTATTMRLVHALTCSQTVHSLEEARDFPTEDPSEFTMCIQMPPGTSYLHYSSSPITFNFIMVGNGSVVQCDPAESESTLPRENYLRFPLLFEDSDLVRIENIHFEGCLRPLRFVGVMEIELVNTNFSDFFPAGAVEVFNSPRVTVEGCRFTNNTSLGIGTTPFSGNAGGLAVGYNNTALPDHLLRTFPNVVVSGTHFVRNNASAAEGFQYSVPDVLRDRVYNQRGGGIACYFGAPNYQATITIERCTFDGNEAVNAGGGVYMFLTGENNNHTVSIIETDLIRNRASDGGGLEITFDTDISPDKPNQIFITDSNFEENTGDLGGGFKSIQINAQGNLNMIMIKNTTLIGNQAPVGSGLYFQSRYTATSLAAMDRISLEDCRFINNTAERGVLFLIENTVELKGTTEFRGNIGPSIRVSNSLLHVQGEVMFVDNHRHEEGFSGTLYLSSFGQLLLHRNTSITFINNTGSEGACIVVKSQTITSGFTKQLYNPQCFLTYEDPIVPPPEWQVEMTFIGNRAVVGPAVYMSKLDACQWFDNKTPFFSLNRSDVWPFMTMGENYIVRENQLFVEPDYYIQTEVYSIDLNDNVVEASPGDSIEVAVVAQDQLGHNTSAFLDISALQDSGVEFSPDIVQTQAGVGRVEFSYRSSERSGNTSVLLNASFTVQRVPSESLTLVHQECLPGYFPREDVCVCEETEHVILCEEDRRGILLADGLWGAPPQWSRTLVTYRCPAGYCNCIGGRDGALGDTEGCLLVYNDPNHICHQDRNGVLCGECREGYGVGMLTTHCRQYTEKTPQVYWLIPIYLLVVVPVMVLIVKLGIHFPSVLKGFLLYVQIAPTAVTYLPETFDLRIDVLDCIDSALALYMPYDFSFHEGLKALESYGLRYTAPVIAVLVIPAAMRIRYKSKTWRGVWTIVLLMYTMTVDTAVSILFCPTLHRDTGGTDTDITIWFFDGSVLCYRGAHLALALVSIITLILLGLLIPVVAVVIYQKRLRRKFPQLDRLERCSLAFTLGLKEQYKWWPLVELLTRYIFIIATIYSPGYLTLPLALVLAILILQTFVHPYNSKLANYTESLVLLNLVVLLALGNTTSLVRTATEVQGFTLWPLLYFPVAIAAVYVVIYLAYQCWKFIALRREKLKLSKEPRENDQRRLTLTLQRAWHSTFTTTTVSLLGDSTQEDNWERERGDDQYVTPSDI